ncbi:MAG: Asp-tRNA(Asn)/Glu-tRNA(Gln) amidotransferase subunit GatB [Proteobacteria bacterium]|nr:Asp-tRNA(Asn)/Glu-tRNA(Gln) amidotransferase subunit GatB [Pseudomonadota bacterium]
MEWETVIGLEIHAQLATKSKIFSCASTAVGAQPNSQASAIDLGLPGVLPVLNERVVEMAVLFGLAIRAKVAPSSVFARKNYFYPDLPKGYQISQYAEPIVSAGKLEIRLADGTIRIIDVTRAHLEEDAGKSTHEGFAHSTGIDLNRAGTPLLEIVSEPQMHSAEEAVAYMRTMHRLVRYLGICDGNMQEGSFRCDANVSVRKSGSTQLGTRTEIKNLNSFKFIERAIEHEVERQIEIIENGAKVVQETRLYDPDLDETRTMRSKEDAHDYRYFPDPDLLPIRISEEYLASMARLLPELPDRKRQRFVAHYRLSEQDADLLCEETAWADYFEQTVEISKADPRFSARWITGELFAALNRANLSIENSPLSSTSLGKLIARIDDETISGKIAKQVFDRMWETGESPDEIINLQGLRQVTDDSVIERLVIQVLENNPQQIEQYKSGKDKVFGFFVGQVMKLSEGKANPSQVNQLLKAQLDKAP